MAKTIFKAPIAKTTSSIDHSILSMEGIVEFANTCNLDDVKETLDTQINYNMAISEEGITGKYGAAVGRTLLMAYGDSLHNRAKAYAAAGSDARMMDVNCLLSSIVVLETRELLLLFL